MALAEPPDGTPRVPRPAFLDVEKRDFDPWSAGAQDLRHVLGKSGVLGAGQGYEEPRGPAHGLVTRHPQQQRDAKRREDRHRSNDESDPNVAPR